MKPGAWVRLPDGLRGRVLGPRGEMRLVRDEFGAERWIAAGELTPWISKRPHRRGADRWREENEE